MFGTSFTYVKPIDTAKAGEHAVYLTKVEEKSLNGYSALVFSFAYKSGEDLIPNQFVLFDASLSLSAGQVAAFQKRASRIMNCFDLHGSFNEANYALWRGKEGTICIKEGKNGFMEVANFRLRPDYKPSPLVEQGLDDSGLAPQ